MTMNGKRKKWKRAAALILGVLILLAASVLLTASGMIQKGRHSLEEPGAYLEEAVQPFPDGAQISLDGEQYEYKDGLINILCLGIDGRGKAEENTEVGFGPRADCIVLAVVDTKANTLTLLNISRDTVTPIRWFDSRGKEIGLYDYQLGLQYTMGDGLGTSCEMMEEAVSRMLGGIPIHGYCAVYWGAVSALQEVTGPVTVTIPEELRELDLYHFLEGGEVELTPEQAQIFVQGRDIGQTGSNETRMLRQQEYMQAMYQKIKEKLKRNPFYIFSMEKAVEEYLVTDLEKEEILALAWQAAGTSGEELSMITVPGETVDTMFQDEFHVDQEGLSEILEEVFYEKK